MANHKSAIKRIRQNQKRRMRNKQVRSSMRTVVKSCAAALAGDDADAARESFRAAERSIRKAASKGVIPQRRADRTVSRLAHRLGSLTQS